MAKKSAPAAVAFPDDHDTLVFEDADEFMSKPSAAPMEDVQAQVHEAQAELAQLRQRQEEIERQKLHLEQIKKKQDAFGQGKRDLIEKFNRSLGAIDRDLYNAQKLVDELSATHQGFAVHLDILRGLQPEKWDRTQVDHELDRALDAIDTARDDYMKATRRLNALRAESGGRREPADDGERPTTVATATEDFVVLVKRGLALSLPLIVSGLVGLILAKIMF